MIEQEKEMTAERYLAIRKEAALQIDPETAEFSWGWGQIMDPYGVDPDLPEEYNCIGRISFYDLPKETVKRLWERIRNGELRERDWFDILFLDHV
jgi:hypothetical protein